MKISEVIRANRLAAAGKMSQEFHAEAHRQAMNEAVLGRLERDEVDEAEARELASDQLDLDKESFLDSRDEQAAIYEQRLQDIAKAQDEKSREGLRRLDESRQQDARYLEERRRDLERALDERRQAKAELEKNLAELRDLGKEHEALQSQQASLRVELGQHDIEYRQAEGPGKEAAAKIVDAYGRKTNNFEVAADPTTHPAAYALARDRQFQSKLQTMADAARSARDPDVRERIEVEMRRQQADYSAQQNEKIESLTGLNRGDQISQHADAEEAAAIRAAELDARLASRGIKVDFEQGHEPEIREVNARDLEEIRQLQQHLDQAKQMQEAQQSIDRGEREFQDLQERLESAEQQRSEVEQRVEASVGKLDQAEAEVSSRGKSMLERIQASQERAESASANAGMSPRQQRLHEEARREQEAAQRRQQEALNLQKQQGVSRGLSH